MTWQEHKHIFEPDGSLRDLFIFNTTIQDWQNLLDYCQSGHCPFDFYINREKLSYMKTAEWIFANRNDIGVLLSIFVKDMQVNCHFFDENEIEMDIEPKEVKNQESYLALIRFMKSVSNLLGKSMILTPENSPDFALLEINPRE